MNSQQIEITGRESGPVATVTYMVRERISGAWALVDPTYDALRTLDDLLKGLASPAAIWLTHGHFDHVAGLADTRERWPEAPVCGTAETAAMSESAELNGAKMFGLPYTPAKVTKILADGDRLALG